MERIGRMNIDTSEKMLQAPEKRAIAVMSRHRPGTVGCHIFSLGLHVKINIKIIIT